MLIGLNDAVTPEGTPETESWANRLKPFPLASDTANATLWPWIRFAEAGATPIVKPVEGVTVKGLAELTLPNAVATVMAPVAAPAVTTKVSEAEEIVDGGGLTAPPPSCGMVIWGAVPKFVPVMVTSVPMGPIFGLKSVIVGPSEVTVNPLTKVATSMPVVMVTVRAARAAPAPIVMLALA
jgi:hypothetical protein